VVRIEVPLFGKLLWVTGDILLRAQLDLLVCDNSQVWHAHTFRVDSGAEMTTLPAALAKARGLPFPQNPIPGFLVTPPGGTTPEPVRAGFIKVQVVGMDGTQYWFPCYFLGDPDVPFDPNNPPPSGPKSLLGLTGVINNIRIGFDGTSTLNALYGVMVVEKK
jgi:hypothetical protein